ncbi:MAG TPA: hypothetical protein VIV40_28465 [Kofleriaceae bacterium]
MRTLGFTLVLVLAAACGTDPAADDDGMGSGSGSGSGSGTLEPPARGFQLVSPEITIEAGQEITYCWYFKTPNTETFSIKHWVSKMTDGSHHMIVFFTPQLGMPEGTVSSTQCGVGGASTNVPSWIYAAQNVDQDLMLPSDDGTGSPLGIDVAPGQAGYVQMHYFNTTDAAIKAHVTINAEAHDAGVTATKTAAYVTFNGQISIPAAMNGVPATATATNTCPIPSTQKVWLMSTHAHKQAVHTEVRNGAATSTDVVFASDDWEHPGFKAWMAMPFYTFSTGKLTYECKYVNPNTYPISTGDSAATDEMCMASGYIFPATKATICYNNFIVPN